jgi:hypothetical protein
MVVEVENHGTAYAWVSKSLTVATLLGFLVQGCPAFYRVLGILIAYPYYLKSLSRIPRGYIALEPLRHLIIA